MQIKRPLTWFFLKDITRLLNYLQETVLTYSLNIRYWKIRMRVDLVQTVNKHHVIGFFDANIICDNFSTELYYYFGMSILILIFSST